MNLNWDILASVFPFLASRRDRSHLMRTCRTLYDAGIPYLLHKRITIKFPFVQVKSTNKFRLFCDFILKNPERRARHAREITITGFRPPKWQSSVAMALLHDLALV